MSAIAKTIENYVAAWNSNEPEKRMSAMTAILTEDCLYLDSHLPEPITGNKQHCEFIDRFRDKFPDLSLQLMAIPDSHHNHFRFVWQMNKSNGDIFISGSFFGELNEENKISKLVGFVDTNNPN